MEIPAQCRQKHMKPKLRTSQPAEAHQHFIHTTPTTDHAGANFHSPAMLLYSFNTCRGVNLPPSADGLQSPGLQNENHRNSKLSRRRLSKPLGVAVVLTAAHQIPQ